MISAAKPLVAGSPSDARPAMRKATAAKGIRPAKPPRSGMWRVCALSYTTPTMTKRRPVTTPWLNICIAAPVSPTGPRCPEAAPTDETPSSTKPMWLMLLLATSRFRSVCRNVTSAPYRMLMTASTARAVAALEATSGNMETLTRMRP